MTFDCLKTFLTDDMFHFTGVFNGSFFIDAKLCQPMGKQKMTFVHCFRNTAAGIGQCNEYVLVNMNVDVLPEIFHGNADARLFKFQFMSDVDGADTAFFLPEH